MSDPRIDYEGELAESYHAGRDLSDEAIETWRRAVAPLVPVSGLVVDIGAGTGRFASPLARLAGRAVVAIEPAAGMRAGGMDDATGTVLWVGGLAESLPLATGSVGLGWTAFTAHYFDLAAVGREFRRVLASTGCLLVWHAFPDVFDDLEWFRWMPEARAIDEERIPSAPAVIDAFASAGLAHVSRTEHRMRITSDRSALADRLAHRSISTLRLISDEAFERGLLQLRAAADADERRTPVYATNVMLEFRPA